MPAPCGVSDRIGCLFFAAVVLISPKLSRAQGHLIPRDTSGAATLVTVLQSEDERAFGASMGFSHRGWLDFGVGVISQEHRRRTFSASVASHLLRIARELPVQPVLSFSYSLYSETGRETEGGGALGFLLYSRWKGSDAVTIIPRVGVAHSQVGSTTSTVLLIDLSMTARYSRRGAIVIHASVADPDEFPATFGLSLGVAEIFRRRAAYY